MNRFVRRYPTPSMGVAFTALLIALGGTAVALPGTGRVDSGDIRDREVRSADIGPGQVKGSDIGRNAVDGAKVRNESLTGADISESTLGTVPTASNANSANSASTANSATTANTAATANSVADAAITPSKLGTLPAAHVFHSVSQSGDGTFLSFDSEEFDNANMHDNVANNTRLTAPIGGIYLLTAIVGWESNTSGSRTIRFRRNRGDDIGFDSRQAVQDNTTFQDLTTTARLAAGDFIEVVALESSTGSPQVLHCSPDGCPEFSMNWLAP